MSEYSLSLPFREGLQPREPKYGSGDNQRVWEYSYREKFLGINLGDIAAAPTEAIMCPTTPWLELGGGTIENRIASISGDKLFGTYNRRVIEFLTQMRGVDERAALEAARQFAQFLVTETGMRLGKTPAEIRDDVIVGTEMHSLETAGEHVAIFYGGSVPAPSGSLRKKGIKIVVLTNVTPSGRSMSSADMAQFTFSAAQAANLTGADSLTVPAVGTGFAAAFGFGLSQEESLGGFFKGATDYIDNVGKTSSLRRIDYNIYARPTADNAREVTQLLHQTGVINFLASKG